MSPEVQAAIIAALATISAAVIAAIMVVIQIGKQARNAINQNILNDVSN
jgi:hypothetical protein